ncbi:uncharacterized protein LOC120129991 [Hibiscus syriacus]|uniref:uncharacterized protein LOC120129991 n=1 Tax=Hibiscus syriacus TaxID=106335 RepID=UPI001924382C|nr:uncharacterized protein LOC120129991 [Hibiscus syriacus]
MEFPPKVIDWITNCCSDTRYSIDINGSLIGYFKGAKGIRQGDRLSPILFVLVMNFLSNLLNTATNKGVFAFHLKCKKISLTHLSFADDLLIFCKGNIEFVMGVITVLDSFYELPGLKLNAGKCEIFTTGLSIHILYTIIISSGFKPSRLPIRYLGVPLVTKKLTDKDCQALLDNIKNRLHQWSRKKMSYAVFQTYIEIKMHCKPLVVSSSAINTKEIWEGSRPKDNKVTWEKLIWFPLHITKHSVISWKTLLDRLPTKDRLQRFGLVTNTDCIFCSEANETQNHLFANFLQTSSIWRSLLQLSGLNRPSFSWYNLLEWAVNTWKGKSMISTILKLSW